MNYGFGTTLNEYEEYLKNTDPETYQLYLLSKNEKYDSLIIQCKREVFEYKQAPEERMYQAFLASAYYQKGLKDSAYHTVLNFLKEKNMDEMDLGEITYYSEYILFYPLAADKIFQKKILDFYISNYKKRRFPKTDLGIELILLEYSDQRTRALSMYADLVLQDSVKRKEIYNKNVKIDQENQSKYLTILKNHPEYITESEVGDAFRNQFILMHHVLDNDIREKQILPMLKRAMEKKEILPETYVDQLGRSALLTKSIKPEEYQAYTDSLCVKFNCVTIKSD